MFSSQLLARVGRDRLLLSKTRTLTKPCQDFHGSALLAKEKAGRYKVTLNRTRPLTYEMAFKPHEIGRKKDFNSLNTANLENTFLAKEEIGQDLPHKMLTEDMFIRKFIRGTFPEMVASEIIVKRQHNLVRIAFLHRKVIMASKVYFLLGYSEELLSYWLKCPVKLEIQSIDSDDDIVFKYI